MTAVHELFPGATGGVMATLVDRYAWGATPLGPVQLWPGPLRTAVRMMLESPQPALLFVGPDLVTLYNDAASRLVGPAHPGALGTPVAAGGLGAIWPGLEQPLRQVLAGAGATSVTEVTTPNGTDAAESSWTFTHTPLRGDDGVPLGVFTTVGEERERAQAARKVSEAAAARLRAMVQGIAAIVWEAQWLPDLGRLRFTFVSDRAEELLGHPTRRLLEDPDLWPAIIHPDDRDAALAYTHQRTAAGLDHDLTYRAIAADGRVLWLHEVVHVVTDLDGNTLAAQGLTVDVTEQKRAERAAAFLAETGRLVAQEGSAEDRLNALAHLVTPDLGDASVVSMIDSDGFLHTVCVATSDAAVETAIRGLAPTRVTPDLHDQLVAGLPLVAPITEESIHGIARDADDEAARTALGVGNVVIVPLLISDRLAGLLSFVNFGAARFYHLAELDLAGELGRRASLMLAADRQRTRERHLRQVSADLASAGSVAEAARLLVARLPGMLDASAVSVYVADPVRGIRLVHADGAGPPEAETFAALRLDAPIPVAAAVRTGEPVWIRDREEWAREWPRFYERVPASDHASAALPLAAAGRIVGAIALRFGTPRGFPDDERDFALALVAQAAPAFERAASADERRMIAETLQTSLLPPDLPRLDRLPLAARYLPGAHGTQAGGDWYDVLPLDDGRVAIAVGDVVGQGARAAAIMGQLRSALSGYLLEGHEPPQALERLDRFAGRVAGAAGSTVACLVLDPGTGDLVWSRAGHPPPLLAGPGGCRTLEDATGTVLGVRGRPTFTAGFAHLEPGENIILYTDGLVERRGELVDDGIARLADMAARHHGLAPTHMADTLLTGALAAGPHSPRRTPDPSDDVALIIARLVPAPLRLVLPAQARMLRELRAALLTWAAATGIDEEDVYDLQLAVGEAAANAVEHAYSGREPGPMLIDLTRSADGSVRAHIRDEGTWRPAPDDKGYRGRGLELIRDVSSRMQLNHGPDGTEVRFTLPPSVPHPSPEPRPADQSGRPPAAVPSGPAALRTGPDGRSLEVHGELDLAGVRGVRAALLRAAAAGGTLTVDLRFTTYLASAGVALLVEVDRAVRTAGGRLRLLVAPADVVRRALAVSGVDGLLEVDDSAAAVVG